MKTHHRETLAVNIVENGRPVAVHYATETWWDEESHWLVVENTVWVLDGENEELIDSIRTDSPAGAHVVQCANRSDANRESVTAFDSWQNAVRAWAGVQVDAATGAWRR